MNFKNSVGFIVAIAVCVVIFASCLVPAVLSVTEEKATYRNTGSYFATAGGEDTHTIIVSASGNSFIITTDGKTDRTPSFGTYNPGGVRTASAIAIGVYEAYNDDGVLTSQAGVTPTASQTIDTFRTQALNGNDGNTIGTYQLWNYYIMTLYHMMGLTVLGNTDSQYMLGTGVITDNLQENGLTTQPYTVGATNTDSTSLFIENSWGNVWEFVGDTVTNNRVLLAGNTLGGRPISNIDNKLVGTYDITLNANGSLITGINLTTGEGFGIPYSTDVSVTTIPIDGNGINDGLWSNTGLRILNVGGGKAGSGNGAGLFAWSNNPNTSITNNAIGSRLAYVMTDYEPTSTDYGYVITFGENGNTITGVQALIEGVLTDKNPTGTTLNSYWDFDSETGIGPFGSYYAAINLSDGANTDDETEARLSTQKGAVGYILDPTDWTKTLAGTSYTSGEYNIMLIIPTVYWGANDGKLYMSNSPDTFSSVEGLEMAAYAHTYTVDPAVDTKNPMTTSSASLAIGEDSIVRLYETGDVYVIKSNGMTKIGQASGDNTVTFTITGTTLGYTIGTTDYTESNYLAYIADKGNYVYAQNPFVVPDTDIIIIGGYAYDLEVKDGDDVNDLVDIGYCASGVMDSESENYLAVTATLNPVSNHGYTVTETDITVNLTEVKTNLNQVNSVLFTTAWDDSGTDKGDSVATYTYFLVPEEIHYSNPSFVENSMWIVLLILVGTISIVAVVVAIVRGMED